MKFVVEKIDRDLVGEFDLTSGREWIIQIYKQFGIDSYDVIKDMSDREPHKWVSKFRWTQECEDEFLNTVIEKNRKQAKRIGIDRLKHDYAWLSLDIGPGYMSISNNLK
jgi:hypothetical protein